MNKQYYRNGQIWWNKGAGIAGRWGKEGW
jgi:hypothetical protein